MTILKIDSSISGETSVSRILTRSITDQLAAASPEAAVVERDLVAVPLAHLTERGQDADVLQEFLDADTVVIGAPMYNFSVPSQLKAWIDRIAVAGKTFQYGANGPEGLAGDKRVIVAVSRGGFYEAGNSFEHVEAYLKPFFNFIGIEPEFVRAEGTAVGPEQRDAGLAKGLAEVERLAA
ncbi:NAD(P)H-dependent oxidoreductase [Sphingomonas sp. NSE70-1]|uniref:FMN dependent NADH:quinone oxidoreductase n=1 Tax=Sphingomonas caseinilyticus TaxID=2908205 RepID=A0ABT0RTU7_9SPHN|nr:NAD(P)H-dependent oxidoreductase [Sphingomonas caseinilyticus]MCL6698346.1 NAD(P)H-dependent oxidoreductase [Sphingomonas caseinilyticus]